MDVMAGYQSAHRKAHVGDLYCIALRWIHAAIVSRGISLAKHQTQSSERFLPPWRNAVPKL